MRIRDTVCLCAIIFGHEYYRYHWAKAPHKAIFSKAFTLHLKHPESIYIIFKLELIRIYVHVIRENAVFQ